MISKSLKWILFSVALCSSSVFAATLQTSGGTLTGATGVNVNGVFYDVSFVDGSCNGLFAGCINSAFTFQSSTSATAAAQALFDQVLLGAYDTTTLNTNGCNANTTCSILTPYSHTLPYDALTISVWNSPTDAIDQLLTTSITPTLSTGLSSGTVFAVWTPSVPVPGAVWLFGSGLIGLAGAARRRRIAVA
jgi:hypothetical protein